MSDIVTVETQGEIGLVALNNPPVNAASHALRSGLLNAIQELDDDPSIEVIAIYGSGRTFIAGADIKEFGKPAQAPGLPQVCDAIEATKTPIITVLHGTALGGGLEVALAAHIRVALPSARMGLPEINLGIFPGAGGTQRAPRLTGWDAALDMILTGRHITAARSKEIGLIDQIIEGEPKDVALIAARDVLNGSLLPRITRDISIAPDPALFEVTRRKIAQKSPHLLAPQKAVDAIEMASGDFEKGIEVERELFRECLGSDQSRGMIHAFFADRAVQKIPEASATPRSVDSIGVIGGGTMGSGIATSALLAGLSLILVETTQEAADRAKATITANLDGAVTRGKMAPEIRDRVLNQCLSITTDFNALATVDLVIEAVFEDMSVKKDVFSQLNEIAKPGAILASNTSYLDINVIANMTSRPQDVIGLHFFSPAHIMRLLEVVVADKTAPEVVATGFALAKRLGKIAVRAGVCDGFIGNRILRHYGKVALYLVEDGASPEQVDQALEEFGFAMGPFAVSDLAGLDIGWATRKRLAPTRPAQERVVSIPDRICEHGWFGRKTGKGYYIYEGKTRHPNPEVDEIIASERVLNKITPRTFTTQEIIERYMTAMILEAARVVEDKIALRPVDVDAVLLNGYGFPRFRGGPLHYADTLGAAEIVRRADEYAKEDPYYWQAPKILRDMAESGTVFADLNKT